MKNFGDKYAAEAFAIAAEMPELEIRIAPDGGGLIPDFNYAGLKFVEPADDSKQLLLQVRTLRAAVQAYHKTDAELFGEETLLADMKRMAGDGFIKSE